MRNIVYCAPFPGLSTTARFARALAGLQGVRLVGLFQEAPSADSPFADFEVVPDALDVRALRSGLDRLVARHGPPHRILGILEDLQVQLAELRAAFELDGPDADATERFRDKGLMKEALRSAGIPCARHRRLRTAGDARAFAADVGFPLVLKPPAGAGCRSTVRVDDDAALEEAIAALGLERGAPVLAEEFLQGDEFSFETLCVRGVPMLTSIGCYAPGPLKVMRTPWIQWSCVLPRRIDGPEFDDVRSIGTHAVRALGMHSGLTHMEWFRRTDGSVAVGEIAMRPPGAQFVSLMSYAYDTDLYAAWARAVVDDAFDGPWERRFAVGIAYLRGMGSGRVAAVEGLELAQDRIGALVVETHLPQVGAPRSGSYEGDGYAIVRHPETAVVEAAVRELIETVRVRYA